MDTLYRAIGAIVLAKLDRYDQQIARQVMSLPMHPDLREADQDRIVSAAG
jgi:dTDP-4-amino-4,6-dideoxygalactose transaminase